MPSIHHSERYTCAAKYSKGGLSSLLAAVLVLAYSGTPSGQGALSTKQLIVGEIEAIHVNDITDPWSGGTITVGGKLIVMPRNLLYDLPANRLTLTDIFIDAPPECFVKRESGLAKSDTCRAGLPGAYVTIAANRIPCGDVIAGDVFIQKGLETMQGSVSFINFTEGYFRLDGQPGGDSGGTMVRLNDPDGRHSIQSGRGCGFGPNCSPDPRFTNDPQNYTNVFTTGYPLCIPSTLVGGLRTVGANPNGTGDPFCPSTNRGPTPAGASGFTVPDATRFAPLQVGDNVTVEGNYETVAGIRYLSAHTTNVASALFTIDAPNQPDYSFFDEVVWDVPNFPLQRARFQAIGFTTLQDSLQDLYAIRVDPSTNGFREVPLSSTVNNLRFAGPAFGPGIFKIRLDVDFVVGVKPGAAFDGPCSVLQNAVLPGVATPAGFGPTACGGGGGNGDLASEFSVISPMSREIIMRTRRRNPATVHPLDVQGNFAPSSQYVMPLGNGLGGLEHANFFEFDLNATQFPFVFEGEPYNLDRRLSPNGCLEAGCESAPQPLDPFPVSGVDPRVNVTLRGVTTPLPAPLRPLTFFTFDPNNVNSPLVANVLPYPPTAPVCTGITASGGAGGAVPPGGTPPPTLPVTNNDTLTAPAGSAVTFTAVALLANDTGTGLRVTSVSARSAIGGTIVAATTDSWTYTPRAAFAGNDTFTYTVTDAAGQTATGTVLVAVTDVVLPIVSITSPTSGTPVSGSVQITANASDNVLVESVQFFVNGAPLGLPDTTTPYTAIWNTAGLAAGTYTITANARDTSGNLSNPNASISLVINTPPPPPPPPAPTTGLVLAFGFDEASGPAIDSSGNNNTGTIAGAARVASKPGFGGALSFDGGVSIVNVAHSASLALTTGMTLEAWVNPSALTGVAPNGGWRTVIMKERATGTINAGLDYALYANDGNDNPSRPAGYIRVGTLDRTTAAAPALPLNTWSHIAVTYDGANIRLYVNGLLRSTTLQTGTIAASTSPLRIGGNTVFTTPGTEFFEGLIDEVRIYNRALSQAEIATDMNTPVTPPAPPTP